MSTAPNYDRTTAGGVRYSELEGSPTFNANRDGMQATQIYLMAWTSIDSFITESFGLVVVGADVWTFPRTRRFPGKPWLFTQDINFEPFDPGNPRSGSAHNHYPSGAKVTISYGTVSQDEDQDDPENTEIFSHSVTIGGEVMTMPKSGLKWCGEAEVIQNEDVKAGKMLPTIEHQLTMHHVPTFTPATIASKVGLVNSGVDLFGAAAETLIYLGANASRNVNALGAESWKLDHRFSQKAIEEAGTTVTWNHLYKPGVGWTKICTDQDEPLHALTTFTALFRP